MMVPQATEGRAMQESELRIERIAVDELVPYENNAKQHTNEQLDAIEASIREFSFRAPVIVWHNAEGRPEIVAGHARVAAAKKLGMRKVPCVACDDLTDAQRKAYTLADNQATMMTGWDFAKLDEELEGLSLEFDMGDFGFDAGVSFNAIDDLISDSLATLPSGESDTFNITFTFPSEHRERIERYVKESGKDAIVRQLTAEALEWA